MTGQSRPIFSTNQLEIDELNMFSRGVRGVFISGRPKYLRTWSLKFSERRTTSISLQTSCKIKSLPDVDKLEQGFSSVDLTFLFLTAL